MAALGTEETLIIDFLRQYPDTFVSGGEICKKAGGLKRFEQNREWAKQVLRRMSHEGWLEANEYAQYKLSEKALGDKRFHKEKRIVRSCSAVREHILTMKPEDDDKPFNILIKEAIQGIYDGSVTNPDKKSS